MTTSQSGVSPVHIAHILNYSNFPDTLQKKIKDLIERIFKSPSSIQGWTITKKLDLRITLFQQECAWGKISGQLCVVVRERSVKWQRVVIESLFLPVQDFALGRYWIEQMQPVKEPGSLFLFDGVKRILEFTTGFLIQVQHTAKQKSDQLYKSQNDENVYQKLYNCTKLYGSHILTNHILYLYLVDWIKKESKELQESKESKESKELQESKESKELQESFCVVWDKLLCRSTKPIDVANRILFDINYCFRFFGLNFLCDKQENAITIAILQDVFRRLDAIHITTRDEVCTTMNNSLLRSLVIEVQSFFLNLAQAHESSDIDVYKSILTQRIPSLGKSEKPVELHVFDGYIQNALIQNLGEYSSKLSNLHSNLLRLETLNGSEQGFARAEDIIQYGCILDDTKNQLPSSDEKEFPDVQQSFPKIDADGFAIKLSHTEDSIIRDAYRTLLREKQSSIIPTLKNELVTRTKMLNETWALMQDYVKDSCANSLGKPFHVPMHCIYKEECISYIGQMPRAFAEEPDFRKQILTEIGELCAFTKEALEFYKNDKTDNPPDRVLEILIKFHELSPAVHNPKIGSNKSMYGFLLYKRCNEKNNLISKLKHKLSFGEFPMVHAMDCWKLLYDTICSAAVYKNQLQQSDCLISKNFPESIREILKYFPTINFDKVTSSIKKKIDTWQESHSCYSMDMLDAVVGFAVFAPIITAKLDFFVECADEKEAALVLQELNNNEWDFVDMLYELQCALTGLFVVSGKQEFILPSIRIEESVMEQYPKLVSPKEEIKLEVASSSHFDSTISVDTTPSSDIIARPGQLDCSMPKQCNTQRSIPSSSTDTEFHPVAPNSHPGSKTKSTNKKLGPSGQKKGMMTGNSHEPTVPLQAIKKSKYPQSHHSPKETSKELIKSLLMFNGRAEDLAQLLACHNLPSKVSKSNHIIINWYGCTIAFGTGHGRKYKGNTDTMHRICRKIEGIAAEQSILQATRTDQNPEEETPAAPKKHKEKKSK